MLGPPRTVAAPASGRGEGSLLSLAARGSRARDAAYKQPAQDARLLRVRDARAREGIALRGEAVEVAPASEVAGFGVIFIEDATNHSQVTEGDMVEQTGLEQAFLEDHIVRPLGDERATVEDATSEDDPVQIDLTEGRPGEACPDDRTVLEVEVLESGAFHLPAVVLVDR